MRLLVLHKTAGEHKTATLFQSYLLASLFLACIPVRFLAIPVCSILSKPRTDCDLAVDGQQIAIFTMSKSNCGPFNGKMPYMTGITRMKSAPDYIQVGPSPEATVLGRSLPNALVFDWNAPTQLFATQETLGEALYFMANPIILILAILLLGLEVT